jgi:hypothetical protein
MAENTVQAAAAASHPVAENPACAPMESLMQSSEFVKFVQSWDAQEMSSYLDKHYAANPLAIGASSWQEYKANLANGTIKIEQVPASNN